MTTATLDVRIVHEPLTYRRDSRSSYFQDLARRANRNEPAATSRLDAHAAEMGVEIPRREQRARMVAAQQGVEMRTAPSRTDGRGGYFSPPLWLMDELASVPRPGRLLSGLIPDFPLPAGVGEISVPRLTTGTQTQVVVDGAPATDLDITDLAVTSTVVTIAGAQAMSMQILEQSPPGGYLDHALFRDLRESYDGHLERQLITGTGTSGSLLGLLSVPTGPGLASAVTYTDASPTAAKLYPFLGQAVAQLGDARLLPPEVWLMRTAREAWILFGEDAQGMPLSTPGHMAAPTVEYLFDDRRPAQGAPLGTYPIMRDDAIPVTVGQDAIVLCRPSDMMLLESEPRTAVDFESMSGVLEVRLQLRAYVAALVARYPTGIATVQGTGLTIAAGW
jgi:HK97 family phage major capsid protein